MITTERVTVTLPVDLIARIDGLERNRSRFIMEAVRREVERRRREELDRSLRCPHPETNDLAELGMNDWGGTDGDADLLDPGAGTAVRWIPGEGWTERGR